MNEQDYYDAILCWFQQEKSFEPVGTDYKLEGLGLLTADVLAQRNNILIACELKNSPYPVGSQGWGSIGQALALRRKANLIYVGCVASDNDESKKSSWRLASRKRTVRMLLERLEIDKPETYEDYLQAIGVLFVYFFKDLGLGLLVVHEVQTMARGDFELIVKELVAPRDTYIAI